MNILKNKEYSDDEIEMLKTNSKNSSKIKKEKKNEKNSLEKHLFLEQKLREERAKKCPIKDLFKKEKLENDKKRKKERNDPRFILYGRPNNQKSKSTSVFNNTDFETVKKSEKLNVLTSRVKRIR
ncbi:hypothetical protein ACQ4LE_003926 [Meloidogyne hapla]|uniref:Uncharacterized protein n=1 Tax=Meloidogyne hapla TaxID=6305 RepID=A0A1I8B3H7_MELHA